MADFDLLAQLRILLLCHFILSYLFLSFFASLLRDFVSIVAACTSSVRAEPCLAIAGTKTVGVSANAHQARPGMLNRCSCTQRAGRAVQPNPGLKARHFIWHGMEELGVLKKH